MHTLYSFDSEAQLRDYLAQTKAPVVTTEHLEFDNPDDGGRDDLPDYAGMVRTQAALATNYHNELLLGIEAGYFAPAEPRLRDYLAHFDYGVRQFEITPEQLEAWGKAALDQIFAIAVDHDLALELNTKSMYKWHNASLYDLAITWYQAAGGHLFTIGSDAHEGPHYEANFAQALAMLKRHGVKEIATYRHHKRTMVPIEPPVIDADNAY
jgi:histidinol-phosphatase (PHP family)